MRAPPTVVAPKHDPAPTAGRPARRKRDVLVQCDRCGVNGTGRIAGDRLVSINIAARGLRHADCGGSLVTFDIEVGQ